MLRIALYAIILVQLFPSVAALAARKDFKGLFGSYRREKFTENEARDTDFGADILLSTLFPLSTVVSSTEDRNSSASSMPFSNFFNVEGNLFFTLDYNWQIYANVGYFTFDTRKENTHPSITSLPANSDKPIFEQFEMSAIPALLGVKYRFTNEDIVPYVGLGMGMSWVTRKGSYDTAPGVVNEVKSNALTGQVTVGVEFYFHSRAGFRLETSGMYMSLDSYTYDRSAPSGNAATNPILVYGANPFLLRYASGLFFLF